MSQYLNLKFVFFFGSVTVAMVTLLAEYFLHGLAYNKNTNMVLLLSCPELSKWMNIAKTLY